jgi:GNAT superfamily N-acetyltransferase
VSVSVAAGSAHQAVNQLIALATESLQHHRGGRALICDINEALQCAAETEWVDALVQRTGLLVATEDERCLGLAAVAQIPRATVLGVFVAPAHRHHGVGQLLLRAALDAPYRAVDGWVLPGDRQMKSLYEAAGLKARRLTMSAE